MPFAVSKIFNSVVTRLAAGRIDSPRLEARLLLNAVLRLPPAENFSFSGHLDDKQFERLEAMLNQRLQHKPLCKILGHKGFYKYDFVVNENVLSPRPDTETLVEAAIKIARQHNLNEMVDFGTGSGCILLSVLGDVQKLRGLGVDISAEALAVAKQNTQNLGQEARAEFICAGWHDVDIVQKLGRKFDLMLSNPPYIPSSDIPVLETEVREYDPLLALDGGADGLRDYRRLAEIAPLILNSGAYILLEAGIGQADDIADIFIKEGFVLEEICKDLGGIPRCVILHN